MLPLLRGNLIRSFSTLPTASMPWTTGGLSTITADTDWSVTATFDTAKYIFNVPENYVRACLQHRRGLRRYETMFFTRIHIDTTFGLPSLLMTLGDIMHTKPQTVPIKLIGPQGLGLYMANTISYAIRSSLRLSITEIASESTEPCFKDENLTVYAVPVTPQTPEQSLKRKREDDAEEPVKTFKDSHGSRIIRRDNVEPAPWQNVQACLGFLSGKNEHEGRTIPPYARPLSIAIAYICVGPTYRGKFDAKRAQELGVLGKDRGKLTRGETVTLANGTVVTPDMCIAPSKPPVTFFVVDCPSPEHIDSIVSATRFNRHRAGNELPVHCIYYRLGNGVLDDARFKEWMSSFGPDVHHILAEKDCASDPLTFTSQASLLLKLSHLDNEIFTIPQYSLGAQRDLVSVVDLPRNVHLHEPYLEVVMNPPQAPSAVKRITEDYFHAQHNLGADFILDNDTAAAFEQARNAASTCEYLPVQPGDNVSVTALGTSSAIPSIYRNVLSNIIEVPGIGNILLDCGEGTYGQLVRRYGHDGIAGVLSNIRAIFISHNHGDHHMGTARVLAKRRELAPNAEPLYLIALHVTIHYLQEYQRLGDLGFGTSVKIIYSEDIRIDRYLATVKPLYRPAEEGEGHYHRTLASRQNIVELANAMRFTSIETTFVHHRGPAYGIVLRHEEGWSIAFSGDTRPCDALVEAGKGVTLLIHEASMADDQEELAASKAHSTFSQALDIGKRMNASNILLTHFSGRYPKLPVIAKNLSNSPNVGVMFDFMSVTIGAIRRLNAYLPALERALANTIEEDITAGDGNLDDV